MTQLYWLRTDLRVSDNTALSAAMAAGPTVALYLITPGQWRSHDDAPCKVDFWLRNLSAVKRELERLNVPLLVRTLDRWDEVPALLAALCRRHALRAIHVNEEYGVNEQRRDQAVAAALQPSDVPLRRHLDQLFAPGFDPQGRFLRHWLPELAGLDDRAIHDPVARAGLFKTPYLPPIVDLAQSRERVLSAFKNLSRTADTLNVPGA
ncbi:hypothetical protein DN824_15715 [Stutzerimonas nosocomialis]|uniref:deoxyribodipyrimidine photo-lyase n=1 Tax=Stutzerimonas nosocomialis TaxID=1056496 RepID=UPI0011094133|nr:hypothetical protein DN824_15715 [Stutzerimonas nosocomialis]